MSWINKTVALFVGLALVACSKQEPQALQTESSTHSESAYTGPKETVSLALNASLDGNEARALQGSVFHRGRLRPRITNGKVKVWLYLGSKGIPQGTPQLYKEKLEFDYNKETNSVHYRGEIQVPEGLLGASDLKMLLVVANEAKIANDVLTMRNVNTEVFEDRAFADDDDLVLDVPYFSKWMDVHGFVTTSYNEVQKKMEPFLDVARTDVLLRPQGHVIKMELSSSVTTLENVSLKTLQIESNAITDGGTYALPTRVEHIGVQPVFTPDLTTVETAPADYKFRKFELPIDKVLDNSMTRTIYLWVGQIPGQTAQTWTRTFAKVEFPNPILNHPFANGWWTGHTSKAKDENKKRFPIYYTKSKFTQTGSTMAMRLNNITVTTPIDRMAYTYASRTNSFETSGYTGEGVIDAPFNLGQWDHREMTRFTRYTWPWLVNQNYVGDNSQDIELPNAPDPNSRNVKFRIPTLEEFAAILPTEAANSRNPKVTVQERVKLGNKLSSPQTYTSSYLFSNKIDGKNIGMIGVRFQGGDNRYKTVYQYRILKYNWPGNESIQIQTWHLGDFYPEIETPEDFINFKTNYPGAYLPVSPEERMMPKSRSMEAPGSDAITGNRYWINKSDGNNATYVEYTFRDGNIQVKETPINSTTLKNTVILVRDL